MIIKTITLFILAIGISNGFSQDFIELAIANDPYGPRDKILEFAIKLCKEHSTRQDNDQFQILFFKDEVNFTYKRNPHDIEAISSVLLSADCEVKNSFNTYYDSQFLPILRMKFDSTGNRIRVVKMKEPVLDIHRTTPIDAIPVGIIDTGVDYNHPLLAIKMRPFIGLDLSTHDLLPYDYSNNVLNELSTQAYSHGTAVADLMAREINARIIPVRIDSAEVRSAGSGIEFLAKKGVRIINLSMGTQKKSDWLPYLHAAQNHPEILFIVAAGNEGLNIDDTPTYPASFKLKNQIVVASLDSEGELSKFSNYGAKHVDVAVLGEHVLAAEAGGGTWKPSGTSFSAPQVARLAVSMLIQNPNLSTLELKKSILSRARIIANLQDKVAFGILEDISGTNQIKKENSLCELIRYIDVNCVQGQMAHWP